MQDFAKFWALQIKVKQNKSNIFGHESKECSNYEKFNLLIKRDPVLKIPVKFWSNIYRKEKEMKSVSSKPWPSNLDI